MLGPEAWSREAEFLSRYFGQASAAAASGRRLPVRIPAGSLATGEFAHHVHRGQPLVLEDFAAGWAMANWTCESIADDFGEETVMRWGYGEREPQHSEAVDAKRSPKYIKLKNRGWFSGWPAAPPPASRLELPGPPLRPSYHWHPYTWYGGSADEKEPSLRMHGNEPLASKAAQHRIKEAYSLHEHLFPRSNMNTRAFKERIEFFLGPPASGADLHIDNICEPILSVQVCGRKRWWLLAMPPYTATMRGSAKDFWRRAAPSATSNQSSNGSSSVVWEFDVAPGEALLFPPGFLHHTEAVGDGCSVSTSLQFRHPFAVRYIRDFAERLLFSKENSFCFVEVWSVFLTGYFRGLVRLQKAVQRRARANTGDADAVAVAFVEAEVSEMFRAIDADGSGAASRAEIARHLSAEERAMRLVDSELVEFDAELEATDWMSCHDLDEDGDVAWEEYRSTLLRIGEAFAQAQAEGACDEGCDTPLPKPGSRRPPRPVDESYPGAPFDRKQTRWGHGRREEL